MKIVHFTTTFLPKIGGIEIVVHNLARQQVQAGHDVTVVAPYPAWRALRGTLPYRLLPLLPKSVIAVEQLPHDRRILFTPLLHLYQRRFNFDVWHVHALYSAGYAIAPFLRRTNQPALLTCHGADIQTLPAINYGQRLKPHVEGVIRPILPHFQRIIAISNSMRETLLTFGAKSQQIAIVPNGVDAVRISENHTERAITRQQQGWSSTTQIILTVGRNHPKKGYHLIPEIVSQIAKQRDDFLWVVIGRNVTKLQPEVERLGIGKWLRLHEEIGLKQAKQQTFTLPTTDLIALYQAADIFAFPSLIESFGVVLLEAMAAGLPVVTTDVPGCRDVVSNGESGLLANGNDAPAFAEKLVQLLADRALQQRLKAAGQREARRYEWERVSANYLTHYREICDAA